MTTSACILAALLTWQLCFAVAMSSSAEVSAVASNVTASSTHRLLRQQARTCTSTRYAPYAWHYRERTAPAVSCIGNEPNEWSMRRAYVSGGVENVHWKYTDNANDPDCMIDWVYYDASNLKKGRFHVSGRITTRQSTRSWCAMPVYQPGGLQGQQWDYCACSPVSALAASADACSVPARGVESWKYESLRAPTEYCSDKHESSGRKWAMLNAYRSGGKKWTTWKFTKNPDDPECLVDWTYYENDGVTKIADIKGSLTSIGEKPGHTWCALPVYMPGGNLGYEKDFCICP